MKKHELEAAQTAVDTAAMNQSLEMLREENKRLKELMAKRSREHQQEMTSFRLRVRSQDDATFAALREEIERLRGWIRVEGGCNDTCTRQILGEICPGCRCGKAGKDAARGAK